MSDLFAKLDVAIKDCFMVSNDCLPINYRNNKTTHVSLAALEKKVEKKEKKVLEKATKEKNRIEHSARVANYAKQAIGTHAESVIELDYDVNDDKLYRNQLLFVAKMINVARYDEKISKKMDEHLE